jgi:hypothetical protein
MKNAPAQMANRETKNATVACRPSLLNGASVRALSTTSSATLASMAATDAIERKALWIIPGPLYTLYNLEPWPSLSCPYSRSTWKGNSANFAVTEFSEVDRSSPCGEAPKLAFGYDAPVAWQETLRSPRQPLRRRDH